MAGFFCKSFRPSRSLLSLYEGLGSTTYRCENPLYPHPQTWKVPRTTLRIEFHCKSQPTQPPVIHRLQSPPLHPTTLYPVPALNGSNLNLFSGSSLFLARLESIWYTTSGCFTFPAGRTCRLTRCCLVLPLGGQSGSIRYGSRQEARDGIRGRDGIRFNGRYGA